MQPEPSPQVESKPLLTSKTILGILAMLVPVVLNLCGVQLAEADVQATTGDVVAILGGALAIYGRFKARQPLTIIPPKTGAALLLGAGFAVGAMCYLGMKSDTETVSSETVGQSATSPLVVTRLPAHPDFRFQPELRAK